MGRKPGVSKPQERDRKKGLTLEGLADIQEAADRLGVSTKTIRRYIQSDKIVAHKIRNIWFVPVEEIEKLIEAKEQEQATVSPMLDEITSTLRHISNRLDDIESHMNTPAAIQGTPVDDEGARRTDLLEDENRVLREEIAELKDELARTRIPRPEPPAIDPQLIKSRAEEIDALKATIVSNERGLSLLREEVREKDSIIKEKEQEILQLLEKLREMESLRKQPAAQDSKKQGLFGTIIKR